MRVAPRHPWQTHLLREVLCCFVSGWRRTSVKDFYGVDFVVSCPVTHAVFPERMSNDRNAVCFAGEFHDVFRGPRLRRHFFCAQDYYVALWRADFYSWND